MLQHGLNPNDQLIIYDVGSRDCEQSVEFYNQFLRAQIVAFECNANTLPKCYAAAGPRRDRITVIPKAVHEYDGVCTFFPIDQQKTITTWADGNPGASSIFKSNGQYDIEHYVQNETTVECTTLATASKELNIDHIDVLWMDLQGAELLALKGMGDLLKTVKFIHAELSFKEMYTGQAMCMDVHNFLIANDFSLITPLSGKGWQEDGIYKNMKV